MQKGAPACADIPESKGVPTCVGAPFIGTQFALWLGALPLSKPPTSTRAYGAKPMRRLPR